MAIDQNSGLARHRRRLGINERLARCLDHLGGQPHLAEFASDPLGGAANVAAAIGIGADARDAEQRAEVVLELLLVVR
jgi:hypothetical protein